MYIVWYILMMALAIIMQIGVTVAVAWYFLSVIPLIVGFVFWVWVDRILVNWIVKWIDKSMNVD